MCVIVDISYYVFYMLDWMYNIFMHVLCVFNKVYADCYIIMYMLNWMCHI